VCEPHHCAKANEAIRVRWLKDLGSASDVQDAHCRGVRGRWFFWGAASAKEIAFDHGVLAETASESASPDKFIVAELFDEDGVKGESDDSKHEQSYW